TDVIAGRADVVAGKLARQRIDPAGDRRIGRDRLAGIFHKNFARTGLEVVSPQAVQIERLNLAGIVLAHARTPFSFASRASCPAIGSRAMATAHSGRPPRFSS